PSFQVRQHRPCRQRTLSQRGGDASVRAGDHIPGGEHPSARGTELPVDHDRARSGELELRPEQLRVGYACDLDDQSLNGEILSLSGRMVDDDDALEPLCSRVASRSQPARSVMRGSSLSWRTMSSRAVRSGERWISVTADPRRASASASRLPLSPPPMTATSRPAKPSSRGSTWYVTSPSNA